jgi:hypothetical protein
MIEWGSPTWGQTGHNVHYSETGSWLESESARGEES